MPFGTTAFGDSAFGDSSAGLGAEFSLLIAGADRSSLYRNASLSIGDDLDARNTCRFVLVDIDDVHEVLVGQEVEVYHEGVLIFAGSVDAVADDYPSFKETNVAHMIAVSCVDHTALADRHLVAERKEDPGQTPGAIVRDLIATYLAQEGITEGTVEDGFEIGVVVFNYRTVAECLDELAQLVGFQWWVDYQRQLHFLAFDSAPAAAWALTDAGRTFARLVRNRSREQYRNRQILRAGRDVTESTRVESFKGDGDMQTFSVGLPIAKVPAIRVNAVTKTVGIQGVDDEDAFDWYWNQGSKQVTQQRDAAELSSSDTLEVTYFGFLEIIVQTQSESEIAARAAIEGGSGIWEAIEDDPSIDNEALVAENVSNLAIQKAAGLLRRFARIPVLADISTHKPGLASGTKQTISLAREKLDGDYLIVSVQTRDRGIGQLTYTYKIVDGQALESPFKFFQRMAAANRKFVIRENEVLIVFSETLSDLALSDAVAGDESDTLADWQDDPFTVLHVGATEADGAIIGSEYVVAGERFINGPEVRLPTFL